MIKRKNRRSPNREWNSEYNLSEAGQNPNMDYRNLYTKNLFRDNRIILVVNVGRVGIQTGLPL
jgi:hypothetical protein